MKLVFVALLLCLSPIANAQILGVSLSNAPPVVNGVGQDFGVTFQGDGTTSRVTFIAGGPTFLSVVGTNNAQFSASNNAWNVINNGIFENNVLTRWAFLGQPADPQNALILDPFTVDFRTMDATRTVAWTVLSLASGGASQIAAGTPRYWYGGSGGDLFNFASYSPAANPNSRTNLISAGDGPDTVLFVNDNNAGQNNQDTVYAQAGNDLIYLNPGGTNIISSGKLADGGVGIDTVTINAVCNPGGGTPPTRALAALFLYQSAALSAYPVPSTSPAIPIVDAPSGNQYGCFTGLPGSLTTIPHINYNNAEFVIASIAAATTQQAAFVLTNPLIRNPIIKFTITPNGATSTVALALNNASVVAPTTFAPLANTAFVQPTTIVEYNAAAITNFELNTGAGTNDIEVHLTDPATATSAYLVVNGEATRSVIFDYDGTPVTDQVYLIQEGVNTGTAWTTSSAVTNILRLTGNGATPPVAHGTAITYTPATHRASYPRNPAAATPLGFVQTGGPALQLDWSAIPIIYDLIPVATRTYDFTKLNIGSEDEMDLFLYLFYPGNNVALLKTSTGTQYYFTLSILTTLNIVTQSCVTVIGDSSQFFNTPNAGPAQLIQLHLQQNSCCCTTRFPVPFCVQQPKSCFVPNTPAPTRPIINQV